MKINEVAKQAGVSPATVSRVLNNASKVKEETRNRVLRVIEDSCYTPNIAARNLSLQNTLNNIGVVIPDIDNPFFCSILKGITQAADEYNYNVLLFNSDENPDREHRFLQTVREQNLKGIIMIPLSVKDEISLKYLTDLESAGVPVVLADRRIGEWEFSGVFTNDEADSYRAVEILIEAGHRRIATIAGHQRSTPGRNRLDGYRLALKDHGITIPDDYIQFGDFKYEKSFVAANTLLNLDEPPTAIFTANNFSTLAVLRCMAEKGLRIGDDVSVFGFDEMEPWMLNSAVTDSSIQLSLVERPVGQMAIEAMDLLQTRISCDGKEIAKKIVILSNKIVLRGSELMH